ncbi:uncharacterized protein NECHADRAFT_88388 [Fusarium vanettenii 77-13-4]|uniref:Uncharacterized protein n=1 Tax=Fusarium vanettenii (strain ATCC MYA-4622 / CBS 123669 / FGSC 9596 / NRRL 45880 / 77-13-4) TaxID=660122 RepID=C7ZMA1_FUSV7|nr:uncharacterized protein NECHADRAFT_88388 [Fusarium vanettenii 77-13-4]EEU34880.1 hypothetical protein NECHADRAFT_88388 [Fusarium vanettenii 77-13-4]
MSLSKPQKEGLTATLSTPEDFLNWEHEFLLQAHRLGLQQHLKRKTLLGDELAIPDIRKRRYTKTATAQRTIRSHTDETNDGTPDDIQETVNGTWSISDLTDQGQKIFQQDLTFYQLQEKVFEKQKKAIGTLQDWVIRMVSPNLIQTCSPRTIGQAALKWLDQWEEAMAKGRQREVPETLHNSAWALYYAEATKGRVARGAFHASYAGEDPQGDAGDARVIEGQYHSAKTGERKR